MNPTLSCESQTIFSAHHTCLRLLRIASLLLLVTLLPRLEALTITKANNTTAISSGASWVNGIAPTSADTALFDSTITGPLTISNTTGNTNGGNFLFTNIGGAVTIGLTATYTLNLNATYAIDMSAAAADVTIGATAGTGFLRWASTQTGGMNVAAGRTLTFNSNFSNAGNTKTIVMTGSGNIIFNGSAGSGGATGFSIQGGTSVTMNGTGAWSGSSAKEVIYGTLNLGSDNALGAATLTLGGTNANTPTLAATTSARTITNNLTLTAVTTGNATITGSNALTVNGTLTNSGGNRTLTVNNTDLTTFGGNVALSEASSNRVLTINGSGNVTISGVIANGSTSTASGLTYSGTGLLSLSNANTFAGTLTASSGTVRIDNALAAQSATVSVGVANAVTFGTGITTATFGNLSGAGDLALTNTDTAAVALLVGGSNANATYSGVLSGSGSLEKVGTGTQTLSGASTYTGGTTISAGTLALAAGTVDTGHLAGSVVMANGSTLAFTNNSGSSDTLSFANALTVASGGTATINFGQRSILNGNVTGDATTTLKLLSGTLDRNDIGGDWADFNGTLIFNDTNSTVLVMELSNNGGTFDTSSLVNATVDVQEAHLRVTANSGGNTVQLGALTGSASAILGGSIAGGAITWQVGAKNISTNFAGVIADGGTSTHLVKVGTGTQTLSNTNTYTGTTTVNAGSLNLTATGSTGTGAVTVANGGTILGTGTVQGSSFTAASGSSTFAGNGSAQSDYGTLTFTPAAAGGTFDFLSGSSVFLGINPGSSSDLLNFVGDGSQSLLFNGNLSVTPLTGYTPLAAETFNLLDWSNLLSTTFHSRFSASSYSGYLLGNGDDNLGFDLPDISGTGYGWDISSFTTNGSIAVVSIVPEPSRALLLILGIVGVVHRRRRHSSQT